MFGKYVTEIDFISSGQERCCSDFQQHPEETNRDKTTNSRVHLHETRDFIHFNERVIAKKQHPNLFTLNL